MQALLLSMSLAVILCYLWYASLIKKRQSAIDSLTVLNQKIDDRLALLTQLSNVSQQHQPLDAEQTTQWQQLHELNTNSVWSQQIDQHLPEILAVWSSMDILQKALFSNLHGDVLDEQLVNDYLQLELDYQNASEFYNQAVTDLNQGVKMFPGSVVAKLAKVTAMPILTVAVG
ncbi:MULTISPECIES: LemA family protein [Shewanella]|uniref:LemA family protein n=1 Tax=Shewanella holmiensis TaxID=2952222 RepID=A0A9X2WM56_9GAMM|nr:MULTISPECIES: LemA family protein [Shewanella]MCT7941917.1 LemA family protein [Shewanella holmiensis]MDP5146347.1 LemA family protein [Shewanella sp. ULN5]